MPLRAILVSYPTLYSVSQAFIQSLDSWIPRKETQTSTPEGPSPQLVLLKFSLNHYSREQKMEAVWGALERDLPGLQTYPPCIHCVVKLGNDNQSCLSFATS